MSKKLFGGLMKDEWLYILYIKWKRANQCNKEEKEERQKPAKNDTKSRELRKNSDI